MRNFFILLIAVFLVNTSCEKVAEHKYGIRVRNKTQNIICIYASYILPDTMLAVQKPLIKEIQPGSSAHIYDNEVNDLMFNRFKNERITIFILSKDTISKYSWNELRFQNKILKRYEITEKDLINMGGSVVYP